MFIWEDSFKARLETWAIFKETGHLGPEHIQLAKQNIFRAKFKLQYGDIWLEALLSECQVIILTGHLGRLSEGRGFRMVGVSGVGDRFNKN